MATTTFSAMIPTPQPKKPGPPVPPRPQQSSLLKTQQRDASSSTTSASSTSSATTATSQRLMNKVGLEPPHILNKRPTTANANNINTNTNTNTTTATSASSTSVTTSGGRTVIYKSPSLNLQKRQEEREKRNEAGTQTTTTAITRTASAAAAAAAAVPQAKAKLTNGTQGPKPPLKLRKAPDVPTNFKPRIITPQPEVKENETRTNNKNSNNTITNNNNNNTGNDGNIVIVQPSSQAVVTLNRHHSMGAASPQNKPSAIAKDTRLSLGKADFERVGMVQVKQLQPTTHPLPKPRKIVKVPVATLDVDDTSPSTTTTNTFSSNTLHVNLFKRSKTSIENFTSRSNITTVNTGTTTGSFLSGKTVEIKNNLKNAAERLFSEIMVNQQKQNALESNLTQNTIITKHERAIQHQAADQLKANNANNITVVNTNKDYPLNNDNNCTRINITNASHGTANNLNNVRQVVSAFNSPEKKSAAFHEMLISELAAMRTRSCSMENLQTTKQFQQPQSPKSIKESTIDKQFQNYKQLKTLETQLKTNVNEQQHHDLHQHQHQHQQQQQQRSSPPIKHHDDIDADNIEDADGDAEEDLKKTLKVITGQNTPRKRTPSGCSSDSSPYGTERSARIRTSDWIEVGDNGKQVTLTSCHISLEDSGLEDEERMDEMSSSGVGDSWDSVKEAEQQNKQQLQQQTKRTRNVKRIMSTNDLPPLPKSLSGINKMLASDSGLVSDVETEIKNSKNNDLKQYEENQKENNKNLNLNNKVNNNNISNNNALNDASDKFNNSTSVPTTATTTASISAATPLKEINGNETISEIPPAIPGSKLDTQIATLRQEMFGLRQLDLSLLSQLWALNDSIQEFRTMIQEQDQEDDETYSAHSRSPSPYESVSSEAEDEILNLNMKAHMELKNGNVITTQPKLTKPAYADNEMTNQTTTISASISSSTSPSSATSSTVSAPTEQQQKSQLIKPPLPKPLDVKPVARMRSAPPPPPTHRKSQSAPPRPT